MIELAGLIEASPLATALRRSVWVYPLINAGHIFGIALLIGSVVPMDLRLMRHASLGPFAGLRVYALAGAVLAMICGALLFAVQATEYLRSPWFLGKVGLILLATVNAGLFVTGATQTTPRRVAAASLGLWIPALICGRMIAYG